MSVILTKKGKIWFSLVKNIVGDVLSKTFDALFE